MGKISIDLNSLKAAGIYTLEIDNSQRTVDSTVTSLRMVVGFSNKGPFNRPVLVQDDAERIALFGDVDEKLEHKGCFFNKMIRTSVTNGPVIAMNLLKVDTNYNGPDQVNYVAMSLAAGTKNPKIVTKNDKYCEYDYLATTLDHDLYDISKGDSVPCVGNIPYAALYNRSRFWTPDKELLSAAAARGLDTADYKQGSATYEYTNLLNFGNVGTEEMSVLVMKATGMNGYEVTAESWYGGKDRIPYGWIRPYDYISDYFITVICVKGNWTNYPILANDPIWGQYFDKKGILKNKLNNFISAEGISLLGSWTGCIIPDFVDKQGNNLALEKKVNANTEKTGLLMSLNVDALNVLTYDYSGFDTEIAAAEKGEWVIDIDNNGEGEEGEGRADYIVDMVGHEAFMGNTIDSYKINYYTVDLNTIKVHNDCSLCAKKGATIYHNNTGSDLALLVANTTANPSVFVETQTADTASVSLRQSVGYYINVSSNLVKMPSSSTGYSEQAVLDMLTKNFYYIPYTGQIETHEMTNVKCVVSDNTTDGKDVSISSNCNDVIFNINYTVTTDNDNIINSVKINKCQRVEKIKNGTTDPSIYGITFLSYNYTVTNASNALQQINNVKYFNDASIWNDNAPISNDDYTMFIITNKDEWIDSKIKVGDYVQNKTFKNENGAAEEYRLIPGLSRVTKKQFIQVNNGNQITYKGKTYDYVGNYDTAQNGSKGFYLITCVSPVLVENGSTNRQLPITDDSISNSLRFFPIKGLSLTSRHRPGYDENGALDMEGGIEKIYGVLEDEGIHRGLVNPAMVDFRYIIDSMSYGLQGEMGGKAHLAKAAMDREQCTAILNLPSAKQFAISTNPYFCDTYTPGTEVRPGLNTKYIPEGGNSEMGSTAVFSLPLVESGSKFAACFWPNLIYTENGKSTLVPPAADVANVLNRKFTGVNDPYCICANQNGILSNKYLTGIEFDADITDREYLEPFGVNTIIKDNGQIMIYGNQTAYQDIKSDLNKLHVRENLNTAELNCKAVLKKFNFLYNTASVRATVVQQLTAVLQPMQTSGALSKFEVLCDETNNTADVINESACIVDIALWFNHGMEKIVQRFTINRYTGE